MPVEALLYCSVHVTNMFPCESNTLTFCDTTNTTIGLNITYVSPSTPMVCAVVPDGTLCTVLPASVRIISNMKIYDVGTDFAKT